MGLLSRGGTEVLGRLLPPQEPQRPLGADVFRAMAVGMVGWFHIWQQTWINPGPLQLAVRTGYIWVDGMILLSAFCLWLPYARARAARGGFPGCEGFWRRRALRILPCYYAAVLFALLLALRSEGWSAGLGKDLAAHLTLTHMLFYRSYLFTSLGSVTWTVGVLAGFYLLFPLLARAFWRWPLRCLAALYAGQLAYSWGFALKCSGAAYQMAFNQLPAFLGVWGLGMAGAELYEALCRYAARLPFRAAALAADASAAAGAAAGHRAFGSVPWPAAAGPAAVAVAGGHQLQFLPMAPEPGSVAEIPLASAALGRRHPAEPAGRRKLAAGVQSAVLGHGPACVGADDAVCRTAGRGLAEAPPVCTKRLKFGPSSLKTALICAKSRVFLRECLQSERVCVIVA